MADITLPDIDVTTAYDAATMNTVFSGVAAGLNAMESTAIERGAMTFEHVHSVSSTTSRFGAIAASAGDSIGLLERYDNTVNATDPLTTVTFAGTGPQLNAVGWAHLTRNVLTPVTIRATAVSPIDFALAGDRIGVVEVGGFVAIKILNFFAQGVDNGISLVLTLKHTGSVTPIILPRTLQSFSHTGSFSVALHALITIFDIPDLESLEWIGVAVGCKAGGDYGATGIIVADCTIWADALHSKAI